MVSVEEFRQLALSLPNTVELPHFELTSFRVNKKIFASMDVSKRRLCLMLNVIDQSVFTSHDLSIIYPVPNKWGQKGATYVELDTVHPDLIKDALEVAYRGKVGK